MHNWMLPPPFFRRREGYPRLVGSRIGRPNSRRVFGSAVALVVLALGAPDARAQLRGLGSVSGSGVGAVVGSPGISSIGPGGTGLGSPFGVPSVPDLPGATGSDLNRSLSVPSTSLTTPVEGLYGPTGDVL